MAATPEPSFEIPPLPEQEFASFDAAEQALHAWNRANGINVTRAHNKKNKDGQFRQRDYQCGHYGKPQNTRKLREEDRVRPKRGSSKVGCTMKVRLEASDPHKCDGKWKTVHLKQGSRVQNHPPSDDISVHSGHRRRDLDRHLSTQLSSADLVASQTAVGVSPEVVVATILQADPTSSVTTKDISNRKHAQWRDDLATETSIESLFQQLDEHNFFYRFAVDTDTNRLRHLFWSHPDIVKFYKLYPEVLILDCTYKTNMYDLPLLIIIAMTNMNKALSVAQCWLPEEKEEDFVWALEQLQALMTEYGISLPTVLLTDRDLACMNAIGSMFPDVPSLVCRWHMNRNVLAKARAVLGQVEVAKPAPGQDTYENSVATDQFMELYHTTVDSKTEPDFEANRALLREMNAELAGYLDAHWWKYKTKIVACWTSQYLHFGYRDTSTVEGIHSKCKRLLEKSQGDLLQAFKKLLPWWTLTISKISHSAGMDMKNVPHLLQDERFSAVSILSAATRFSKQ